jgi:hypothetical protein
MPPVPGCFRRKRGRARLTATTMVFAAFEARSG